MESSPAPPYVLVRPSGRGPLRKSAASSADGVGARSEALRRRTSSWWTKNSLRFGKRRTHPILKKPGGGPDRMVSTRSANPASSTASRRRSANCPRRRGRRVPARRKSCVHAGRGGAARSRAIHGSRSVGACGPTLDGSWEESGWRPRNAVIQPNAHRRMV